MTSCQLSRGRRRLAPRVLSACLSVSAGLLSVPGAVADMALHYTVSDAGLTLFNQPQTAPFDQLALRLYVRGDRLRTETVDHFGRERWYITDRTTGEAWILDPEQKQYWRQAGTWPCESLPTQLAASLAYMLKRAGSDSLIIEVPRPSSYNGLAVNDLTVRFNGRILGAPRPVAVVMDLRFPADEESVLGKAGSNALYCGPRPGSPVWQRAFERSLPLKAPQSGYLADVVAVPLELRVVTDLGIGSAHVTIRLNEIDHQTLSDSLFLPPGDFALRGP